MRLIAASYSAGVKSCGSSRFRFSYSIHFSLSSIAHPQKTNVPEASRWTSERLNLHSGKHRATYHRKTFHLSYLMVQNYGFKSKRFLSAWGLRLRQNFGTVWTIPDPATVGPLTAYHIGSGMGTDGLRFRPLHSSTSTISVAGIVQIP